MYVSIIIPAHNEELYLDDCLHSVIQAAQGPRFEIIVVDNASTDRTAQIAAQWPSVRVAIEPKKGLTRAREKGRIEANGDLIAYVDADCRLPEGWLETVERAFSRENIVSLSGPPVYIDGSYLQKLLLSILWKISAPLAYRLVGYMIYGAHFVVRKSALDNVGGFDCNIQFYGEDTDLARRLNEIGEVKFDMSFRVFTSARRFSAEGLIRTCVRYALNFAWPVLLHRPFTTRGYRDIR